MIWVVVILSVVSACTLAGLLYILYLLSHMMDGF